jgi:exopolyphosphatase / guanosine-5'-triphosphate,3'-diphosphate pyrophosphatase
MTAATRGVIDIGSNAARLVVYSGADRAPAPIYNEKLPVSLGRAILSSGSFDDKVINQTLAGLMRFKTVAEMMGVDSVRIVGTAAIRDATNGELLVARAQQAGIEIEVLDGEGEAVAAGLGVLSDAPGADGYVADLGGGSLELVRVSTGAVHDSLSFPLGTTRLAKVGNLSGAIEKGLNAAAGFHIEKGLQLHLVGGVWRALAKLDQSLLGYPFRIVGSHRIAIDRLDILEKNALDKARLKSMREVPAARVDALADSVRMLRALSDLFEPASFLTSAFGIREGLLFDALSSSERLKDPLVACVAYEGRRLSRPRFDGDELERWTSTLFDGESKSERRLRHAACWLSDTAWNIHPDHRAEHGLETGLHGNWTGIDLSGRIILARALFTAHGGKNARWPEFGDLVSKDALKLADDWGLAIRLAMRVGGGAAPSLRASSIRRTGDSCILALPEILDPEAVERRLNGLASQFGLFPIIELH